MKWSVAEARRSFSELLRRAGEKPQLVYRRHEHVASVVDADTFQEFLCWQQLRNSRSVGAAFADLRDICVAEDHSLESPARTDRGNSFSEVLDERSD